MIAFRSATWRKAQANTIRPRVMPRSNALSTEKNSISKDPALSYLMKNIIRTLRSACLQHTFLQRQMEYQSAGKLIFIEEREYKSDVSMHVVIAASDQRDNIFAPNRACRLARPDVLKQLRRLESGCPGYRQTEIFLREKRHASLKAAAKNTWHV